MLQLSEYKFLAIIAVKKLLIMPTTYMTEKGFSALVDIKQKKWSCFKNVDELMRGALKELILARIENISKQLQGASSSSAN